MTRSLAGRLRPPLPRRPLPRREALPLALLLLALSSVFVFGGDRSQFYRPGHHGNVSGQTVTLAGNLSAEHRFLMFRYRELDERGEPRYVVYNRFPIGPYALVKLAILPFGDDLPQQILAARLLMLTCFAAAAVLAWLALARLTGDRWIALTATLLACSSYYCLYYNDMISAEGSTNLLGVMLAFHGMAVFAQEGRFRQLLVKTAAAILLGWHVLGLIAPFVLLGLAGELVRARPDGAGVRWYAGAQAAAALARSRYLACGGFAALCCAVALGWNFGAEYLALGGETPLTELPSFRSMLRRSGAASGAFGYVGWPAFLEGQLGRIGGMALPFAVFGRIGEGLPWEDPWPDARLWPWLVALGASASAAALAGAFALRRGMLAATLALAGWGWAIPFRGNAAVHEFEAVFHVGVPLTAFALALLGLRRLLGPERAALALPAIACAALLAFALSARDISRVGHDAAAAQVQRELTADFPAVRRATAGRSVVATVNTHSFPEKFQAQGYYLAQGFRQSAPIGSAREWADAERYDLALVRIDFGGSLTPENRQLFVYPLGALPEIYAAIAAREPAIRSTFDLRLDGRALTWTRDRCAAEDVRPRFFLDVVPLDANDLPEERRAAGFETLDFDFRERGLRFGGSCLLRSGLPDYPIAGVRAGQRGGAAGAVWEASLPVADPRFPLRADGWEDRFGALAAREPALRAPFDVHHADRTLHYLRGECSAADTAPRFFARFYPPAGDGADGRARGGLTFAFAERGLRYGGRCLAALELPDYPVSRVATGQYGAGGELWAGAFPLDPAAWRARYEAAAASPPVLRAAFAVRLDGRTLHYLREECSAADTAPRFFLHVVPLDAGDLPEERRAAGFDNLDFDFADRGAASGGRCLASVGLPDYGVARVRTGQHADGVRLWAGEFAFPGAE